MTKIHPLALGAKLDGAMDAVISARLSALQFLTPHDLNIGVYARDDTVLALAQVGWREPSRLVKWEITQNYPGRLRFAEGHRITPSTVLFIDTAALCYFCLYVACKY